MPLMLVYDSVKKEIRQISGCFTDYAAKNLSDEWLFGSADAASELERRRDDGADIGIFCTECCDTGLDCAAALKREDQGTSVVIIADISTSPLTYMKPGISPSGLLLRPLNDTQTRNMLAEVFDDIRRREKEKRFGDEVFSVETRCEVIRIQYSKILFFEARDRKIYLCTGAREYAFYSTLDGLENKLPDYFIRCHKGFIVNSLLAEKLLIQENAILMPGGFKVPVSRSFRLSVREIMT